MDPPLAETLMREHVLAGAPGERLRRHRLPKHDLLDLSALDEPAAPKKEDA